MVKSISRCTVLLLLVAAQVSFAQDAAPKNDIAAVAPDVTQTTPVARQLAIGRNVTVNLCVVPQDQNVEFKQKGGAVIAAAPPRDKLQFEVIVSGPQGNVPFYFSVPADSAVYQSYLANKDDNPEQVLETLKQTIGEPLVRIVARRETRYTDQFYGARQYLYSYDGFGNNSGDQAFDHMSNAYVQHYVAGKLRQYNHYGWHHGIHNGYHHWGYGHHNQYNGNPTNRLVFNEPWHPFYEVFLPESDEGVVYVPVPKNDTDVHKVMEEVTFNDKAYKHLAVLAHLSGTR